MEQIDLFCHDWAAWDGLYQFMVSPSASFIRSNLNMDTRMNNRLDLTCLIGNTGKPIFCEKWDLAKGGNTMLPGLPPKLFSRIKHLSDFLPTGGDFSKIKSSGFYKGGRELLMLSAHPVITIDNQGLVRGTNVSGMWIFSPGSEEKSLLSFFRPRTWKGLMQSPNGSDRPLKKVLPVNFDLTGSPMVSRPSFPALK